MSWPDRIAVDPEVLAGKPAIRGTRLAVGFILDLLAAGQSEADVVASYPGLAHEDVLARLAYASHLAPADAASLAGVEVPEHSGYGEMVRWVEPVPASGDDGR